MSGVNIASAELCPTGWIIETDLGTTGCYYHVSSKATHSDAEHVCNHLGAGLVAPWSFMKLSALTNIL